MIKKMRLESGVELIPTNVEGGGGTDLTRDGELATDSSDNELKVRLDGATRTVVTEDQAQTITNKIIDADNNTISEIEVDNLKSGVLNTSTTLTGATDSQVPSALAVKTYINSAQTDLSNHINNPTDAHDASAISVIPTGNLISTDTQSALVELQGGIDSLGASRVVGPVSATDNAIARFDSTTGKLIQDSVVTVSDTGVVTGSSIDADTNVIANIKDASIKSGAAIDAAKIANGTVSNAEFQALDGVTSSIQTQINSKVNTTGGSLITPARVDMKQDTLTNLTSYALTATNGQLVFATDSKETFVVKDGELSAVGGGGAGGINYISNPNADTNTNGWVRYKNTPGTAPIDGDGGSPSATYTFTRSTSAPLRGAASFLLTKPAALNAQGEGFSHYFYLDNADKGKVLNCSFDYQIVSGTYADDDMTVWIYDVLNDRLIQPAPFKIKNSEIVEKFSFEFQSNLISGGHTLIIHRSSPATAACTIKFDNFKVGPNEKSYGSAVTDWKDYVPTVTVPTGSMTNYSTTGRWRAVGDSIEVEASILFSGAAGTWTAPSLGLPSGLNIDVNKLAPITKINQVGTSYLRDTGIQNYEGVVRYTAAYTDRVTIDYSSIVSAFVNPISVTSTLPFAWGATDAMNIKFSVPIAGWSSSQIMSSDADTRVVSFQAYTSASYTTTGGGIIPINTVNQDTHGKFNNGTFQYTIPVPGDYRFSIVNASATINYSAATQSNTIVIRKNSGYAYTIWQSTASASGIVYPFITGTVKLTKLKAGDVIDLYYTNNGVTGSIAPSFAFEGERLSGSAQIAASESVSCLYTAAPPTGTLGAAQNVVKYGTKVKDSHGAYNPSTGEYKVPVSGVYSISASFSVTGNSPDATSSDVISILKGSNVLSAHINRLKNVGLHVWSTSATSVDSVPLLQGDIIKVMSFTNQNTPAFASIIGDSNFSITRTGNY